MSIGTSSLLVCASIITSSRLGKSITNVGIAIYRQDCKLYPAYDWNSKNGQDDVVLRSRSTTFQLTKTARRAWRTRGTEEEHGIRLCGLCYSVFPLVAARIAPTPETIHIVHAASNGRTRQELSCARTLLPDERLLTANDSQAIHPSTGYCTTTDFKSQAISLTIEYASDRLKSELVIVVRTYR